MTLYLLKHALNLFNNFACNLLCSLLNPGYYFSINIRCLGALFEMECKISSREFFVVQYPGIVKNDNRALETLGGIQSLNKVVIFLKILILFRFHCLRFYCSDIFPCPLHWLFN